MRLQVGAIGALLLLSLSAQASIIEDETTKVNENLVYQEDAGVLGDAPDLCEDLDDSRAIDVGGDTTSAMLVEVDDESDVFHADTAAVFGERRSIQVIPSVPSEIQQLDMEVLAPDCSYDALDPEAPPYQSISPEAGDGEKIVFADLGLEDCKNSKDYWKFHISQEQPLEIFIEWTNGEWERSTWVDSNDGKGNYITFANTGYTIRSAEAVVSEGWHGKFDLKQRPCDVVDGGAEPVERFAPAPEKDGLEAEFEVREESYVVRVFMVSGAVEGAQNSVDSLQAASHFMPGDKHCHREGCGVMEYDINL